MVNGAKYCRPEGAARGGLGGPEAHHNGAHTAILEQKKLYHKNTWSKKITLILPLEPPEEVATL